MLGCRQSRWKMLILQTTGKGLESCPILTIVWSYLCCPGQIKTCDALPEIYPITTYCQLIVKMTIHFDNFCLELPISVTWLLWECGSHRRGDISSPGLVCEIFLKRKDSCHKWNLGPLPDISFHDWTSPNWIILFCVSLIMTAYQVFWDFVTFCPTLGYPYIVYAALFQVVFKHVANHEVSHKCLLKSQVLSR